MLSGQMVGVFAKVLKCVLVLLVLTLFGCQTTPPEGVSNRLNETVVVPAQPAVVDKKLVRPKTSIAEEWPEPDFKDCSYYQKVEKIMSCREKGSDYLFGYGFFYCNEFKRESQHWSRDAQNWVQNTGQCLQEMLSDNKKKRISPCAQMEEFAFDAHPVCYKQYKICDLKPFDIFNIAATVRGIDLITRKSLSQIINVGLSCFGQYFSSEETATFNRVFLASRNFSFQDRKTAALIFRMAPVDGFIPRQAYFQHALGLLIGSERAIAPREAVKIYSEKFGVPSARNVNDSLFFDCSSSVAKGEMSMCRKEYAEQFRDVKSADAQKVSRDLDAAGLMRAIESLRKWKQMR